MPESKEWKRTISKRVHCPICKKPVALDSPGVPFCSDRCRVLDLGAWASGGYRISSPIFDPELLEEAEQAQINAERRNRGED